MEQSIVDGDDDLTPEHRRRIDAMAKIFRDVLEEYSRRYSIPVADLVRQVFDDCERRQRWGRHGRDEFEPPTPYAPESEFDPDDDSSPG